MENVYWYMFLETGAPAMLKIVVKNVQLVPCWFIKADESLQNSRAAISPWYSTLLDGYQYSPNPYNQTTVTAHEISNAFQSNDVGLRISLRGRQISAWCKSSKNRRQHAHIDISWFKRRIWISTRFRHSYWCQLKEQSIKAKQSYSTIQFVNVWSATLHHQSSREVATNLSHGGEVRNWERVYTSMHKNM